jgi:long-chain acyl-CoA synthetase
MKRDVAAERADMDRAIEGRTVLTIFEEACALNPNAETQRWREGDRWHSSTWSQYSQRVRAATAGLKEAGFKSGEFGLIMARNRPEHLAADLAFLHAGGIPVSLYNTLAPDQIEYIANHCEATFAVVEDAGFYAKFRAIRDRLPRLRTIMLIDPAGVDLDPAAGVVSWSEFVERGTERDRREPAAFDEWRRVKPDDLATLIYTSGTTGPPKAVMITHRNVMWMSESADRYLHNEEGVRHVSYLPLAHAFERFVGHYLAIRNQAMVAFCPDPTQLVQYCLEIRPTQLIGVPRIWEKLRVGLLAGINADPDEQRRSAVLQAIEVGKQLVKLDQARQQPPSELLALAERARPVGLAILSKVGLEECRWAVTGAAPINVEVIEFFQALGLKLWEGWGMSECTVGGSHNPLDRMKNGSVGIANPGVELRLAEDGELLLRGGNVMKGYYKDPEKTAETIDADGWLHTGDVAEIDQEGYARIIDRKKELIITAGGKNISPANLEALLKEHPMVGQACAIGDRRPYVSALIVLDQQAATIWAKKAGIAFSSLAELAQNQAVQAEIEKMVQNVNARVSQVEGIKRVTILPAEWTAESEELTPTLKLKRRVILQKYAREIEEMYERDERRPVGVTA